MNPGAKPTGNQLIRFGPFELDVTRRAIFRNGIRLKLQQQPFSVLEFLIERAPQIVPREDIRRRIWGDEVHVDAEQGIAFCIRQVRSVLNDDSTAPRYIETIPRQGFRFIGKVETAHEQQVADESGSQGDPVLPKEVRAAVSNSPKRKRSKVYWWVALSLIAAALLVVMGAIAVRPLRHTDLYTVAEVLPVTTYPGAALHPCYSPDGRQVTFSWDGEGERNIYVALPRSEHPLRLTHTASEDDFPMWSPDGRYIAFLRFSRHLGGELMLVPALGGEERALQSVDISMATQSSTSYFAWTPDSKWICFTNRLEKSKSRAGLVLLSPETGESRPLLFTDDGTTSVSSPAFSPDGSWLAFARFSSFYNSTILLQHLSPGWQVDGNPIAVREAGMNPLSPVWTRDSRCLLFLDRAPSRLLQVEISEVKSSQPAHEIYVATASLNGLSFGGPDLRLATSTFPAGMGLWAISLKGESAAARVPRKILESKANQYHPQYSPDGRSLAFVSGRDGSLQVWIASAAGVHPRQLTHLASYILGFPCWSPDGEYIAFHARVPDDAELFVARVRDGALRQVTHGVPGIVAPSWSINGAFLYGFGPHNGSQFLFRISVTSGNRELLWEGTEPREVPGRHLLLYGKINQRGIFARRLTEHGAAEPEEKLLDDFVFLGGRGFIAVENGFYYSATDATGTPRAICFYAFDTKKTVDLAPAPQGLDSGLAISSDRSTLLYTADRSDQVDLISLELKRERR